MVEKGRMSEEQRTATLGRMSWSEDLNAVAGADLIVEAVIENLEVKKDLFAQVEPLISESAWLCTNTSSLSIAALSSRPKTPRALRRVALFQPSAVDAPGGDCPRCQDR